MPRRLPIRPAKIIGNLFVLLIVLVMGTIYYAYTFLVWLPKVKSKLNTASLAFLNNSICLLQKTTQSHLHYFPYSIFSSFSSSGPSASPCWPTLDKYLLSGDSTWEMQNLSAVATAWCVTFSNRKDAIIAQVAVVAYSIWITTAPGLTTASAFGTANSSYYSSSTFSSSHTS